MDIYAAPVFNGIPSQPENPSIINSTSLYEILKGDANNNYFYLTETNTKPFEVISFNKNYYYDDISESVNGGIDIVFLKLGLIQRLDNLSGSQTYYTNYMIPNNVENIFVDAGTNITSGSITGNELNNVFQRFTTAVPVSFNGLGGNDLLVWQNTRGSFDGGTGIDFLSIASQSSGFTVTDTADGFNIRDNSGGNSFSTRSVEIIQYSDYAVVSENIFPFSNLLLSNVVQTKAISAGYQILLGGVPSIVGYDFLVRSNIETNFGAGAGQVFNEENVYINVVNSLVQGNPSAASKFASLAAGNTLADKVFSIYKSVIPTAKQTLDGVAFLTRPDGLAFYESVARERGITSENGPAVIALASLLKIAVDGRMGIGNPVNDLIAAVGNGSARFQSGLSGKFTPIEAADGAMFDADDAQDVMPGFVGPPPALLLGVAPVPNWDIAAF